MNDKTAIEKAREALALAHDYINDGSLLPQDMNHPYFKTDAAIDEAIKALAALYAEKPVEDVSAIIKMIRDVDFFDPDFFDAPESWCIDAINQYAAYYHAEQCKACKANATIDNRICGLCGKYTTCSMPFVECCGKHWQPFPEAPLV